MHLPAQRSRSLVNLTPLIDIVFILLIFFMLATNFIDWQYVALDLGEAEEMVVDHEKISLLQIKPDNSLWLNDTEISLATLLLHIKQRLSKNKNHPVVIQPQTGVTLQQMIDVLEPLQKIAGENVSLAKPENINSDSYEN
jgi:biopolymer transport protein ExbD